MAVIDGNSVSENLADNGEADVFKFSEGSYTTWIRGFEPGHDTLDLSGFDVPITWEDIQNSITHEEMNYYGKMYRYYEIDLSEWGGGIIRIQNGDTYSGGHRDDFFNADMFRLPGEGTDGADTLVGGTSADFLEGKAGADILEGGAGNDTIATGEGADTVVFSNGDGHDTIQDFQNGEDKIDLSGFDNLSRKSVTARQDGDDVVIEFRGHPNDSIRLLDFDLQDLDADDFIYSADADMQSIDGM